VNYVLGFLHTVQRSVGNHVRNRQHFKTWGGSATTGSAVTTSDADNSRSCAHHLWFIMLVSRISQASPYKPLSQQSCELIILLFLYFENDPATSDWSLGMWRSHKAGKPCPTLVYSQVRPKTVVKLVSERDRYMTHFARRLWQPESKVLVTTHN